jgi:hypothetical protein
LKELELQQMQLEKQKSAAVSKSCKLREELKVYQER